MATKFTTKTEAQSFIDKHTIPCAGPVFVSPVSAKIEGVPSGWYVGSSVTRRLVDAQDYEKN